MSVPPPRRRIKVAPRYIGVSLNTNKLFIPTNVKANERILEHWHDPTTDSVTSVNIERPTSSSSKDDSEASNSEEEAASDSAALPGESEEETDVEINESEARQPEGTSKYVPQSQLNSSFSSPKPTAPSPKEPLADISQPAFSQSSNSGPSPSRPQKLSKRDLLKLSLDFSDLILESDFKTELAAWRGNATGREIVHLERSLDDDAVSIWITDEEAKSQCSISCLFDEASMDHLITLYDLQRLVAFIAGRSLEEATKRRIKNLAHKCWHLRQIGAGHRLFDNVVGLENPKPVIRRSTFWALSWEDITPALVCIFESSNIVVTVL